MVLPSYLLTKNQKTLFRLLEGIWTCFLLTMHAPDSPKYNSLIFQHYVKCDTTRQNGGSGKKNAQVKILI